MKRDWLTAASLAFAILVVLGFTNQTAPARHGFSGTNTVTNADYIYVHDSNVAGASSGVPNATPKQVDQCSNTQALAWDSAAHGFVCLTVGGGGLPAAYAEIGVLDAGTVLLAGNHPITFAGGLFVLGKAASTPTGSMSMQEIQLYGTPPRVIAPSATLRLESGDTNTLFTVNGTPGGTQYASMDGQLGNLAGTLVSSTPYLWDEYVNARIVASTTYGGWTPSHNVFVNKVSFFISAAGTVGSTNANLRITDGSSNCDCAFACNSSSSVTVSCSGSCAFASAVPVTFTATSIGNCALGPNIAGNAMIEYINQ